MDALFTTLVVVLGALLALGLSAAGLQLVISLVPGTNPRQANNRREAPPTHPADPDARQPHR